jgi:hypothetical protein
MTTNKVKLYRNPERNKPTNIHTYVPEYQQRGLEPEEYVSPTSPGYQMGVVKNAPLPLDNPRAPRPVIRQTYAEPVPSPVGRGRGFLPNVGNNLEQTWSSVDGQIIDDLSGIDPEAEMIDNNDYVSTEALGLPPDGEELDVPEEQERPEVMSKSEKTFLTEDDLQNSIKDEYLSLVLQKLEEEEYLLIVSGECICSGPLEEIQEEARAMAFGEHSLCDGTPIPIDDIVVLKRVPIKVGLFLS